MQQVRQQTNVNNRNMLVTDQITVIKCTDGDFEKRHHTDMGHILNECTLRKFDGGLQILNQPSTKAINWLQCLELLRSNQLLNRMNFTKFQETKR